MDERDGRAPRGPAFCESADEWTARGTAWSFVPGEVAGVVQFPEVGLPDRMFLSPMTCEAENEFLQAPTRAAQKCQTGTRAQTRTQRYTAVVRKNGRRVRVKRTRRIVVQVPVYDVCDTYYHRIDAVATAAHEAMHVLGVGDEAAAECLAFQLVTPLSAYLGASTAFAYEIGRDFAHVYDLNRQFAPEYWSAECRDGGALDLFSNVVRLADAAHVSRGLDAAPDRVDRTLECQARRSRHSSPPPYGTSASS